MPENFQVLAALNEVYGFSFNNSVCRHKESITEPFTYNILQIVFQSFRWNAFCNSTTLITSNLESYHILIISKRFPVCMGQLIHKCRKNHAILRDISCGTTCKKLHFTYLFYQTTPIFAVVTTSWNFFSILNEQASKTLTSFVTANSATTYLNWALWNAARCATIHPLVGTHDCLVI